MITWGYISDGLLKVEELMTRHLVHPPTQNEAFHSLYQAIVQEYISQCGNQVREGGGTGGR